MSLYNNTMRSSFNSVTVSLRRRNNSGLILVLSLATVEPDHHGCLSVILILRRFPAEQSINPLGRGRAGLDEEEESALPSVILS